MFIIGKEWDMSQGSSKGSNQSNAKEWTRLEIKNVDSNSSRELSNFLFDLTTSYHTDNIMEWIESKVDMKGSRMHW